MTGPEVVYVERRENPPPDTDSVRVAIRLGWFLAEVRGRYWWRGMRPSMTVLPADPPYALPLRPQRTAGESRRQARRTVVDAATRLEVTGPRAARGQDFPERLVQLTERLDADDGHPPAAAAARPGAAPGNADPPDTDWLPLAALLYDWDAAIQDALSGRADVLANAYLLGRGLAECYWALGADRPRDRGTAEPAAAGPQFLFGSDRRSELSRLVGRVGPHVDALTPTAVSGSLEAWGKVADDPAWWAADPGHGRLYEQVRRWYELLVLGRDPTTYVRPYAVLRGWRTTLHAFRAFLPQLLLVAGSVLAVGAVVVFLSTNRGSALLSTLLGVGGTLGLTVAAVSGRAKSARQRLLARLRRNSYGDLVAIAVTSVPPHPHDGGGGLFGSPTTERRVRDAVRERPVAAATPMTDGPVHNRTSRIA